MQTFVESEGILLNVKASYWYAYSQSVQSLGLARTDESTFWRVMRTGGDRGRIIRDARPRHLQTFDGLFEDHLDDPQAIDLLEPHDPVDTIVGQLRSLNVRSLLTMQSKPKARSKRLADLGFPDHLPPLVALPRPIALASAALGELMTNFAAGGLTVVLAASERLARAANEANLPVIGIASGASTANRLAGAGALPTFPHLEAFLIAQQESDPQLVKLGIHPSRRKASSQNGSPQDGLLQDGKTTPSKSATRDRSADRDRRRRERMTRRNP